MSNDTLSGEKKTPKITLSVWQRRRFQVRNERLRRLSESMAIDTNIYGQRSYGYFRNLNRREGQNDNSEFVI